MSAEQLQLWSQVTLKTCCISSTPNIRSNQISKMTQCCE